MVRQAMTARNRAGQERGQAARAEIRRIMLAHAAGAKSLTAKEIARQLTRSLSDRTIQWHMQEIRREFDNAKPAAGAIYPNDKLAHYEKHGNTANIGVSAATLGGEVRTDSTRAAPASRNPHAPGAGEVARRSAAAIRLAAATGRTVNFDPLADYKAKEPRHIWIEPDEI
jgi:hypothetical protein